MFREPNHQNRKGDDLKDWQLREQRRAAVSRPTERVTSKYNRVWTFCGG